MKAIVRRVLPARVRQDLRAAVRDFMEGGFESDERRKFMLKAFRTVSFNGIPGDYAEFGCCGCGTFGLAYRENVRLTPFRRMWAFDSFQGLPQGGLEEDKHPQWVPGAFATSIAQFKQSARSKGIPESAYSIVPGYYEDTIGSPSYGGLLPERIAIAYIDCDLYLSTVPVLAFLATRMAHGTILAFDDYYCYSESRIAGERRAFLEFQSRVPQFSFLPYMPFAWGGMSFIVEQSSLLTGGN